MVTYLDNLVNFGKAESAKMNTILKKKQQRTIK